MKRAGLLLSVMMAMVLVRGQGGGRGVRWDQEVQKVIGAKACFVRGVTSGGIRLVIRGIYVDEGLMWVSMRAANRSAIDFRAGAIRFVIRDKHTLRRRAVQEMSLAVVVRKEMTVLRADSVGWLCDGLVPRVPGHGQELVVEWGERNGDRRLRVYIPGRDLLRARKLK
jgi:Domain of unknown function (DUF4138)